MPMYWMAARFFIMAATQREMTDVRLTLVLMLCENRGFRTVAGAGV